MKITKDEAFALAKKTKENGCCSQYGQTIVYLMDEIERLNILLDNKESRINKMYASMEDIYGIH